jgi:predicted TIM-barrel fold metal-dependent hydrolase
MSLFAGHTPQDFGPYQAWVGPGSSTPKERLNEQDMDGVQAEILYASPQYPMLTRTIPEREPYLALIRAYNDWLAQEYCAIAPDRLLGQGIIPVWDLDASIDELTHCKELGLTGVTLGALPSGLGRPVPEDDRFWATAVEIGMPLSIHVQLYPKAGGPSFDYPKRPEGIQAPDFVPRFYRYGSRGAQNAVQLVMSGVFDRFPNLQIYFAENQISWVPGFVEQFDRQYERNCYWARDVYGLPLLKQKPSEYIRQHIYWGFFDDPVGLRLRHEVGVDRIMWSTDFPHVESSWPNSRQVLHQTLGEATEEERRKLTADNAVRFFHLK